MPATAGRVRMPANNRVHSSAALQTHGIWQSAIGYDPYAPAADKSKGSEPDKDPENAYASFRDLLTLARITNTNTNETRGACKKCGRVGHLTFQCRNFLSLKGDRPAAAAAESDDSALKTAKAIFEKIKKKDEIESEDADDEDDEISSSDSDVDPEMERIIAERFGRPLCKKAETLIKKSKKRSNSSESDDEEERRKKRKHRHRRRRHRKSDDVSVSDRHRRHKRRRRRARESDSDNSSGSESDRQRNRRQRRHKDRRSVLSSGSESTGSSSDDDERRERRRKKRSRGHRGEED